MDNAITDIHVVFLKVKELWGLESCKLILDRICEAAKLKVISSDFHVFENGGLTINYILSESNVTLHTWPEHCFMRIHICTCSMSFSKAINLAAEIKGVALDIGCKAILRARTMNLVSGETDQEIAYEFN